MKMMKRNLAFSRLCALTAMTLAAATTAKAAPMTGAVFTTNSNCTVVNGNIYNCKEDVYIDGGPRGTAQAGLSAGSYFVKVTTPSGTLLGSSPTAIVTVGADGEFVQCYQLSAILRQASNNAVGYDTTTNPGGEYKVWVSKNNTFPANESKTDNFKAKDCHHEGGGAPTCSISHPGVDANGHSVVNMTVQDTGSGLASIVVTKAVNATVVVPLFTVGTKEEVVVVVTKIDNAMPTQVELTLTNVAGNTHICRFAE